MLGNNCIPQLCTPKTYIFLYLTPHQIYLLKNCVDQRWNLEFATVFWIMPKICLWHLSFETDVLKEAKTFAFHSKPYCLALYTTLSTHIVKALNKHNLWLHIICIFVMFAKFINFREQNVKVFNLTLTHDKVSGNLYLYYSFCSVIARSHNDFICINKGNKWDKICILSELILDFNYKDNS
jgi:hypothetical protein